MRNIRLEDVLAVEGKRRVAPITRRPDTVPSTVSTSPLVPSEKLPLSTSPPTFSNGSTGTDFAGAVPVASSQAEALSELMTRVDNQLRSQLAETETLLASLYTRASEAEAEARAAGSGRRARRARCTAPAASARPGKSRAQKTAWAARARRRARAPPRRRRARRLPPWPTPPHLRFRRDG